MDLKIKRIAKTYIFFFHEKQQQHNYINYSNFKLPCTFSSWLPCLHVFKPPIFFILVELHIDLKIKSHFSVRFQTYLSQNTKIKQMNW